MRTRRRNEDENEQTLQQREAEWHDNRFRAESRGGAAKFYAADSSFSAAYRERVVALCRTTVLELGCGTSAVVLDPRVKESKRHAIDISEVAVERMKAADRRLVAEVMDCHAMSFSDASFGLVCGSGILHHLDLQIALPEIRRVLKQGGRAVFLEPLGHNPVINLYRAATPKMRTADEHPLLRTDLSLISDHFATMTVGYYGLTAPAAGLMPEWMPLREKIGKAARGLDQYVLARERFKHLAWMAVIEVGR